MTVVELPEKYRDWVEDEGDGVPDSEYLLVQIHYFAADAEGRRSGPNVIFRRFVPPKPKPNLPDVGVCGVLRFKGKDGEKHRAIANYDGFGWCVYGTCGKLSAIDPGTGDVAPGAPWNWTDEQLLAYVDDNGFTVELKGL
jgi:hypothetical protein